jgi:hypothetical protein
MKKLMTICVVVAMCAGANVGLATISLGGWDEGAAGSTHEYWDFTPGHVTTISGDGYSATPDVVSNPDPLNVVASIGGSASWDGVTEFTSTRAISVSLEIPNYEFLNDYKVIWVDIGNSPVRGITISATDGGSTTFNYVVLPGQGDAEFGVKIWPNPYVEVVNFYVLPVGGAAVLDYIHVDTICIPEPATVGLLGLGALSLIRRKK